MGRGDSQDQSGIGSRSREGFNAVEYNAFTDRLELEFAQLPISSSQRQTIENLIALAKERGQSAGEVAVDEERVSAEVIALMESESWKAQSRRLEANLKLRLAYQIPSIVQPSDSLFDSDDAIATRESISAQIS